MFSKRNAPVAILVVIFTLLILNSVLADDGRINRAPYHFGGDTLFCTEETGCTLLDKDGHELANWPRSAIADAFDEVEPGQNVQVDGEGQGTYGSMQLWAVSPDEEETDNNMLCLIGFDEWGKQNNMCFEVTEDYHFEQAPLPVNDGETEEEDSIEETSEPTVTSSVTPPTFIPPTGTPEVTVVPA